MYPKVKVRTEGEDDQHEQRNWSSLLSLKDIQFLLLQDSCSPVKEYRDTSPLRIARIPNSYEPNIASRTESPSQGTDKKSCSSEEEDRLNIRASCVPRPRAVISSPDNDALIANKDRVKASKTSIAKNHNSIQSRHTQCKIVHSEATDENNTRRSKGADDNKIEVRRKKESAPAISNQRRKSNRVL